jgi:bacteriorhodopsin
MGLFGSAKNALDVNPTVGAGIAITTYGSAWYWAVTAVMALSTFIFLGLSFTVPRRNRVFHYITASITLVASIAYFSMASNLGYTGILVEFTSHFNGSFREIFYVRYIDWVITTPVSVSVTAKCLQKLTSVIASPPRSPPDCRSAMAYNPVHSAP